MSAKKKEMIKSETENKLSAAFLSEENAEKPKAKKESLAKNLRRCLEKFGK